MYKSKYAGINPDRYKRREPSVYEGLWHGESVSFSREFRGHVFTDEECEALCRGQSIEVHNLHGKYGVYAVQGRLDRVVRGFLDSVKFHVVDTVPNNENHKFGMPLYDLNPAPLADDGIKLDDDDLKGIYFGEIEDILKESREYREQQSMAEAASSAALEDDSDPFLDEESDYENVSDANPYGEFEENELLGLESEVSDGQSIGLDANDDFSDEDYDDIEDEDMFLDVSDKE